MIRVYSFELKIIIRCKRVEGVRMRNLFRKENEQTWCLRWGTVGLLLVILVCGGHCGYAKHRYQNTEKVPTMVNTIGPYNNPSETYDFYSLPFCQPPKNVQHRHASLGEKLEGDHLEQSLYDIRFQVEIQWQALCTVHVLKEEVDAFRKAIMERYQYEILIDDVPVEGFVGEILPDQKVARLYTHVDFLIYYNQDRVISARLTTDENRAVPFSRDEMEIEFSYSVTWVHTDVAFANRKNFNEDKSMFPHAFEIHWLSIINSVVLVVLLTGFVSVILYRIVKSDYSRYSKAQDTGEEDYGWKLVHGDVFRPPPQTGLYCALIGLGAQFMLFILFGLMMSVAEIVRFVIYFISAMSKQLRSLEGDIIPFPSSFILSLLSFTTFMILVRGSLLYSRLSCSLAFTPSFPLRSPSMPGGGIYIIAIVMFSLTSVVAGFVSCGLYQVCSQRLPQPILFPILVGFKRSLSLYPLLTKLILHLAPLRGFQLDTQCDLHCYALRCPFPHHHNHS